MEMNLINLRMMILSIEAKHNKNGHIIILIKRVSMELLHNFLNILNKVKSLKIKLNTMAYGSIFDIIIDTITMELQKTLAKL